jgi:hypothetical protein
VAVHWSEAGGLIDLDHPVETSSQRHNRDESLRAQKKRERSMIVVVG